ncbi:hypothetical protein IKG05_01265 [Candidatus Saccharibacteria bacterium]|nr:hypothetical protein [Candidatus Saccharibacteria bacterium]
MEKESKSTPENHEFTDDGILKTIGRTALQVEETKKSGETIKPKKIACMEVYPFSFEDGEGKSNVFEKITSLLPYWKNLGINTIWLAPVYPSPRKDMGYDISNYEEIDERFGMLEDFDNFVTEAHNQGQKVLMDLVLNHTSTEHEWFKKALSGDPKYRNFYYFTETPQEDWHNFFDDQSAWAASPNHPGEYYLHSFHENQADLRWFDEDGNLNQDLLAEFQKVIDFWTKEHHVDGFRLDVPQAIDKDFANPERSFEIALQSDGEQSSLVIEKLFGDRPELITTVEVFDVSDDDSVISRYSGPGKPIQFAMNAWLAMQPESEMLEQFSNSIKRTPNLMVATQSHDTSRKDISNEVLTKLLEQEPEAVCLYMGQEIGLDNPSVEEFGNEAFFRSDAQADMQLKAAIELKKKENGGFISQAEIDEIIEKIRSNARANSRAPINDVYYLAELARQEVDPSSTYNFLKKATTSWVKRDEPDPNSNT